MEWQKNVNHINTSPINKMAITYMDKLVNQLKERFEFKFIHPSIYDVGYKILTLIESDDYGSYIADIAINKFINKNLELDNHIVQLKKFESYVIQDLIDDNNYKVYVVVNNQFVPFNDVAEIKHILRMTMKLTGGKANPSLFTHAFLNYQLI